MKKGSIIFAGILALGLVLILAGRPHDNQSASVRNADQAANIGNSSNAQLAPGLSLNLLDERTVNLSDYRGKKPVVLDFWASWCPNCRRDMPRLNSFYEKYKDKVEIIGINLHEDNGTVKDFITSRGINFPIALDPNSLAAQTFGIQYTNTHFLINKDGKLVRIIPGDISESDIKSLIKP